MITPRPYQLECLDAMLACGEKGITRQLVSLPTGTGKTVIMSMIAKHLQARTLVIAHTEELIEQAKSKFEMIWPEASIGIVQAESDEIGAQVVIASIQTVSRDNRLHALARHAFDLCIVDEAHHAAALSYRKVLDALGFLYDDPSKLLVGVTATPRRSDGQALGCIFQEIVFERSIGAMVRSGYLCPLIGKQIVTWTDLHGVGMSHGDFNMGQLSRAINTPSRNDLIVENFMTFASDRKKTIAFCADVQHAKDLAAAFHTHGIMAEAIYGEMKKDERRRVLDRFAAGEFQVITNCSVLTEGFDQAEIDTVVLARPTASSGLYTQMIGRGTRTHPLKENCIVLDFCDNSIRHTLCNFKNTLDGVIIPIGALEEMALEALECDETRKECNQASRLEVGDCRACYEVDRVDEIEFFDRTQFSWVQVGESWHLNLTRARDVWVRKDGDGYRVVACSDGQIVMKSDRPLPLTYALGTAEDWARSQTTKGAFGRKDAFWRARPVTDKQIDILRKFGLQITPNMTGGQAAELIDRKINEPATDKQRWWLSSRKISFDHSITKNEARRLIGEMSL